MSPMFHAGANAHPVSLMGTHEPKVSPVQDKSAQSPRSGGMAETSGAAPSVEMKIFVAARESARAAAAASRSGRRARVPSFRALQAAGLAEVEGAQWMSRARQEEEARKLRAYKENVREYKDYKKRVHKELAARCKAGQVLVQAPTPDAANIGTGGTGGVSAVSGALVTAGKRGAVEISQQPQSQQADRAKQHDRGDKKTRRQSARPAGTTEASVDPATTSADEDNELATKLNGASSLGGSLGKGASATSNSTSTVVSKLRWVVFADAGEQRREQDVCSTSGEARQDIQDGVQRNGECNAVPVIPCHFEGCSKPATFGVNGIVRYW